jgi:light-regulated signal transduction histidine kinase (bacteriophytochrome)
MSSEKAAAETRAVLTALTGFSERAGHDMAGPLNQASSLLALFVKRYRNQIDADADQLLDYLQSAAERMESVSRGVRKFMDIAGKTTVPGAVDLNDALAAARERLSPNIAESGALIVADRLPVVTGDAGHLTTVFENLIGNCIKFRREGEPPRVNVSTRREGAMHEVMIRDEGIGIATEDNDTLFVAFKRLNGREYPGPGLGLAAARMIVEMHGGRIAIEPVSDGTPGTCVRFTLQPQQP